MDVGSIAFFARTPEQRVLPQETDDSHRRATDVGQPELAGSNLPPYPTFIEGKSPLLDALRRQPPLRVAQNEEYAANIDGGGHTQVQVGQTPSFHASPHPRLTHLSPVIFATFAALHNVAYPTMPPPGA